MWAGCRSPKCAREQPLAPSEQKYPLDVDALAALLGSRGPLAQAFPSYEHRPQQIDMLRAVAEAFNNDEHLIVEAGTGVGKSLAYLMPALAFALRNRRRVVVSTNTITLQDQLYNKDLPDLQRILGAKPGQPSPLGPRRDARCHAQGPLQLPVHPALERLPHRRAPLTRRDCACWPGS